MTDYCWLCEREHYKPHPTIPNVMSSPKRKPGDRMVVCEKHKHVPMKWECPNCRLITSTKHFPYATNDNQMCPKCGAIMGVDSDGL